MADSEPVLSKVVPVLVAALVCDTGVVDPSTGKKSLIGVFDRIWVGRFPTTRPLLLYIKIADAEGKYRVLVRIVHADENRKVGEGGGEVDVPNRLLAYDYLMPFPPVPFEKPGRYEFQIFMNDVYLGRSVLDVQNRPAPATEG